MLGVGGVLSMMLGALMLIRSPMTGRGVSLFTALSVVVPFAVIVVFLMRLVLRSHVWKPSTGKEEMIGEEGQVTEPVGRGRARAWYSCTANCGARPPSNGETIPKGARVRVRKVAGLTLEVEPMASPQAAAS